MNVMEKEEYLDKIKNYDFLGEEGDIYRRPENVKYRIVQDTTKKNNSPFLSLIIPTHKRPNLLKQALNSVANQKELFGYEIIIVDNSGLEAYDFILENEKVISSFYFLPIRYYRNDKTCIDNWNVCLSLAEGMWVCMLHDDDILFPRHFEIMYEQVKSNSRIDFLGVKNYEFRNVEEINFPQKEEHVKTNLVHYEEFMYGMPVSLLGAFFRRDKALKLRGFEQVSQMADYVFVAKFSFYYKTYVCNAPLYGYRISLNQDSANNDMNYIRRVADYYLWLSIARRRTPQFKTLYVKNCQYNLVNRIHEYNLNTMYGKNCRIDLKSILGDCDIDESKLYIWEKWLCKGIHGINIIKHYLLDRL